MTEAEWLACVDVQDIAAQCPTLLTRRKLLLFFSAYSQRFEDLVDCHAFSELLELPDLAIEHQSDFDLLSRIAFDEGFEETQYLEGVRGEITQAARKAIQDILGEPCLLARGTFDTLAESTAHLLKPSTSSSSARLDREWAEVYQAELQVQASLLREVIANPYRPVVVHPEWLTSTVRLLAEGIEEQYAFDRMPILADALQDAGCDNDDILNHCRQPGEHVRGCWVVDLILGKS